MRWLLISPQQAVAYAVQSERVAADYAVVHGVARAARIAARLGFLVAIEAQARGRIVDIAHVGVERGGDSLHRSDSQLHEGILLRIGFWIFDHHLLSLRFWIEAQRRFSRGQRRY